MGSPQKERQAGLSKKGKSMAELFNLTKHHGRNITGKGVKIAIFDSGLAEKYLKENKERLKREKEAKDLSNINNL